MSFEILNGCYIAEGNRARLIALCDNETLTRKMYHNVTVWCLYDYTVVEIRIDNKAVLTWFEQVRLTALIALRLVTRQLTYV